MSETLNTEQLLKPDDNRYVMFPIEHDDIWQMYKRQVDCFWRAEEVDLSKDLKDWEKLNEDEKKSWINDQYFHPIESLHTLDEVLDWFDKNEIDYIDSIPSADFENFQNYLDIFVKKSKGDKYSRLFNQFSMIFNKLGSDGGLFVVIGKKK